MISYGFILVPSGSILVIVIKFSFESDKIDSWILNRLHLNVKKTKYMIVLIQTYSWLNIIFNNNQIDRVSTHKFLGVILD